jgi:hypothetical protein
LSSDTSITAQRFDHRLLISTSALLQRHQAAAWHRSKRAALFIMPNAPEPICLRVEEHRAMRTIDVGRQMLIRGARQTSVMCTGAGQRLRLLY